jgi:CRP-like cAMP-binding protein
MSQEAEFLRGTELFGGFAGDVLERFASLGMRRRYSAGEIVFVEMSEGDEIFVVLEGAASVQLALANRDQPVEVIRLGTGDVFGEVTFVEHGQRSATVTAETDLEGLVWSCDSWRAECEKDPKIGYQLASAIARILAQRLRRWNVKLLDESLWGFA